LLGLSDGKGGGQRPCEDVRIEGSFIRRTEKGKKCDRGSKKADYIQTDPENRGSIQKEFSDNCRKGWPRKRVEERDFFKKGFATTRGSERWS